MDNSQIHLKPTFNQCQTAVTSIMCSVLAKRFYSTRLEVSLSTDTLLKQFIGQVKDEILKCTGLPHYNSPHYNMDFITTRSCVDSQMVIFPIVLM